MQDPSGTETEMKMIYGILGLVAIAGLVFYMTSCSNKLQVKSEARIEENQDTSNNMKTKVKENPYFDFRNQSLSVTPEQLQLKLDNKTTITYGVVMDWDIGKAVVTVVAFQTGDASMYVSAGQIYIGGYAHDNIKKAGLSFVEYAQQYLSKANPTTETKLPDKNCIGFYFLTNKGKYYIQETVENVKSKSSEFTHLFDLGNNVITEYRITIDK